MFDHQVVVKFLDGSLLKGFGSIISPGENVIELQDLQNNIHFVDLSRIKAVFYVKSFEGIPHDKPREKRETRSFASGEKVRLKFMDGEEIIGLVTNTQTLRNASGFYITPTEELCNNYRVYVNRVAVEGVYIVKDNWETNLLS